MTEFLNWWDIFDDIVLYAGLVIVIYIMLSYICVVVFNFLDRRRLAKQTSAFIELTPPANTDKTPEATKQLFAVLYGLEASRTFLDRILRRKVVFSLEVVSTKQEGIRYLLRIPKSDVANFEHIIVSYLPEVRLRRVEDYLPNSVKCRVVELKQTGHFAYPINTQLSLGQHDPMAYLTGIMTKLSPDELMGFQIVVSPTKVREANAIAGRLMHNDELVYKLGRSKLPTGKLFDALNSILFGILDGIGDMVSGPSRSATSQTQANHKQQVAMKIKPARMLSLFEQQLAESVHNKLSQPLFSVNIRLLVAMDEKQRENERIKGVREWLSAFTVPKYQSLKIRRSVARLDQKRQNTFKYRLPSLFRRNTCLLSAAELADLYHFPHSQTAKTENVVKSLSKTLPAPLTLKNGTKLDVVLGRNHYHGSVTDIGLTADERERHVFVVGGTGNGKTTLLKYSLVQDIKNGKGVAVIDPHGDLAQELLTYIPKERIKDVIYFNPADVSYPIGLNLLEVPKDLDGDQLLKAKDFIAETVVSIMRKTFSDDGTGGHRIEYVLRNAVLTALTVEDATLFTVYDILTNKDYRKPIVDTLEQDWLKNFWKNEFSKAGDYQQVKMMSGVTSKIGRYHASVSAERILEQPKSTIDFDEILDGKILICNLAKGLIGEDTSEVFGISILAKLQLAAFRRIEQKRPNRKPFYAYVDEFQNFATVSFVEMLSEARKYKLFLTMAEQTTSQQDDDKIVNTILTNAGTIICFKSNSIADERQMLHLFNGKVKPGEISNLPSYNFYAKLSGGLEPQDPVSGITIVIEDDGNDEIAKTVIKSSRTNYAKKYAPLEKSKAKEIGKQVKGEQKGQENSLLTNSEITKTKS